MRARTLCLKIHYAGINKFKGIVAQMHVPVAAKLPYSVILMVWTCAYRWRLKVLTSAARTLVKRSRSFKS